ncbi:MAG: class I SAM-dependent methyltransferase [Vicinamibacterales bacterium]
MTTDAVRRYWNERIHDLEMTTHPPGSREFFADLDAYRFDKLRYLPELVDFGGFAGRRLLEVGCGIGTDLARFARGGAVVTGIDLSQTAIDLAAKNFAGLGLSGDLRVGDGEALPFPDASFDVVYGHGVLQYAVRPERIVAEAHRVLVPGGQAIFMVYNRRSWLNGLSKVMKVALEHEDAPVLRKYTIGEFRALLAPFAAMRIVPERFPVKSRLHGGWKGAAFNTLFVGAFNALPRALVRPLGWHLMAFCRK